MDPFTGIALLLLFVAVIIAVIVAVVVALFKFYD